MANTAVIRNPRSTGITTELALPADTYWAKLEETERHSCIDQTRSRPLGDKTAWDASGCLKDRWQIELYPAFRDIINEAGNYEKIYGKRFKFIGRRRRHPICVLHLFMVGDDANWKTARPTVVVSCGDGQIATRTVNLISGIESIKSLKLGFSFLTHREFVPFTAARGRFNLTSTPTHNLCGSSALFPPTESIDDLYSDHCLRATIGGVLCLGPSAYYILTVAHTFYDDDDEDDDSSVINSTCTDESVLHGSSETHSECPDEAIPSIPIHAAYLENCWSGKDKARSKAFPAITFDATARIPSFLGYLNPQESLGLIITNEHKQEDRLRICRDMDWALVRIHDSQYWKPNKVSVTTEWDLNPRFVSPKHSPPDGKVVVAAGSSGVYECHCSGIVCGIILPGGTGMQDAWYIESESNPGDCGAWVMNPDSGAVYAIVVATLPKSRFTYVLPAEDVFSSVMERSGTEITSIEDMFPMEAPGKLTYDILPPVLESPASDSFRPRSSTDWASTLDMLSVDGSKKLPNDADSTYESVQLGEIEGDQKLSSSVDHPGQPTDFQTRMDRKLPRVDRPQSSVVSTMTLDVIGSSRETSRRDKIQTARTVAASSMGTDFAVLKTASEIESIDQSTSAPNLTMIVKDQPQRATTNEDIFSSSTGQQKPGNDDKQQISPTPISKVYTADAEEGRNQETQISGKFGVENSDLETEIFPTARPPWRRAPPSLGATQATGQQVPSSLDSKIASEVMSKETASPPADRNDHLYSHSRVLVETAVQPNLASYSETAGSGRANSLRQRPSLDLARTRRSDTIKATTRPSTGAIVPSQPRPEDRTMPTLPEGGQLDPDHKQELPLPPLQLTDELQALTSRYRRPLDAKKFFERGRVFALLWHESTGASGRSTTLSNASDLSRHSSEEVFRKTLRVVVVKEGHGFSLCLPINTYGGRGVSKPDLSKEDRQAHAIIYMSDTQPGKLASETDLIKQPIAVDKASADQTLPATSRINFSKIHTVEWNVKVMNVGKVSRKSMPYLMGYWQNTMSSEKGA